MIANLLRAEEKFTGEKLLSGWAKTWNNMSQISNRFGLPTQQVHS
jgi:hypothetical protein